MFEKIVVSLVSYTRLQGFFPDKNMIKVAQIYTFITIGFAFGSYFLACIFIFSRTPFSMFVVSVWIFSVFHDLHIPIFPLPVSGSWTELDLVSRVSARNPARVADFTHLFRARKSPTLHNVMTFSWPFVLCCPCAYWFFPFSGLNFPSPNKMTSLIFLWSRQWKKITFVRIDFFQAELSLT